MGKMDVHFSSESGDWGTPQDFFDKLDAEFHFSIDVCASFNNNKCPFYIDKEIDGLSRSWYLGAMWWCNPPYGRGVSRWVKKATVEAIAGNSGVMLLPSRTDTKWFSYIWSHKTHHPRKWVREIRFIKGRLKFEGAKDFAPFPSMLVIFGRPK